MEKMMGVFTALSGRYASEIVVKANNVDHYNDQPSFVLRFLILPLWRKPQSVNAVDKI